MSDEPQKYKFVAVYNRQKITVEAETSYKAQLIAAAQFKAKKSYDVIVFREDIPIDPASLG